MVAVRLTPDLNMVAVASPEYLARHGLPKSPSDLHDHACINWRLQTDGRNYRWEFNNRGKRIEVAVDGPVVTNHADIGVAAAQCVADSHAEALRPIRKDIRDSGVESLSAIAAELNRRGILTPRSRTWHRSSVSNLRRIEVQ